MTGRLKLFGKNIVVDTTPDSVTFDDVLNVSPSGTMVFGPKTLTGFNTATSMTALAAGTDEYSFNGTTWSSSLPIPVAPAATIWLRRAAGASYSTDYNVGCTVGGVSITGHGRTMDDPFVTIPVLQPAAGYTGTQLSGFTSSTPPADPVRITGKGKPTMHWIYGFRGMSIGADDELMGLETECRGGVAYVDVYFENSTPTRVYRSAQSVYSPRTGQMETRVAYWFKLRVPTGQRGAGKVARLFAKATPNDGNMQPRVLGWYDGNRGTGVIAADTAVPGYRAPVDIGESQAMKEFFVFPRATKWDAVKNVKADGTGHYLTLQAALDDCAVQSAPLYPASLAWDIVCFDADNNCPRPTTFANRWGGVGGAPSTRIRAAPGVVARIYHNSTWDPYNTKVNVPYDQYGGTYDSEAWYWYPMMNNLLFYGGADGTDANGTAHGKVVLDYANHKMAVTTSAWGSVTLFGCELTNKTMVDSGSMFTLYANGQVHDGGGFQYLQDPGSVCLSLIDMDMEFNTTGYGAIQEYRTNRVNGFGNPHDNCHGIIEGYIAGYDGLFAITGKPAIRISYTGAGVARVRITYKGGATNDRLLELQVNGATTASVTLRNPSNYVAEVTGTAATGKSVMWFSQLATWVAAQTNWGCVEPPSSLAAGWAAFTLEQGGGEGGQPVFLSADIKDATTTSGYLTIVSWQDSHNEGVHWLNTVSGGGENFLMLRCVEVQCHWSTGHLNIEIHDDNVDGDGTGANLARDIVVAQTLQYSTNHGWAVLVGLRTPEDGGDGNGNGIGIEGDHVVFIDCTMDNVLYIRDRATNFGPYSGVERSIFRTIGMYSGNATWNASKPAVFAGNVYAPGSSIAGQPIPPYASGLGNWNYTTFAALFKTANDWRPATAGALDSHKTARASNLQAYDVTGRAYNTTSDYPGAYASGSPNFTAPLATFSDATYPIVGVSIG